MKSRCVQLSHDEDCAQAYRKGIENRHWLIRQVAIVVVLCISVVHCLTASSQTITSPSYFDEKKLADSVFLHIKHVLSPIGERIDSSAEKCGFRFQVEVRRYRGLLTPNQQAILQELFSRPGLQASVLSPSGHFRVHYDTTGLNTPAMIDGNGVRLPGTARAYVDSVGAIFDYVWDVETRRLGYPSPPGDRGAGGGNEYDIYILELSRSFYGQTIFNEEDVLDSRRPNPTYMSFIEIDNDYLGYYSRGLNGLRVTAAHEFHHAIQVGNYGFWQDDEYYYELTSTWIEDVVFDAVNDYYQYLPIYFGNTSLPFNSSDVSVEYARALWGKFIEKRFGQSAMKRSWEYMSSIPSLKAIDASLLERGTNFVRELPEFSLWHFYTGHRADPINYFAESSAYPEIRPLDFTNFIPPSASITNIARSLSMQFYQLAVEKSGGNADTVTMALTNINRGAAEQSNDRTFTFSYRFTTEPVDGSYETLRNGLKVKLIVDDPTHWKSLALLNSIVSPTQESSPYPNPFFVGRSGGVAFPIEETIRTRVTLNIYSSGFDLICSRAEDSTTQFGKQVVVWDGKDTSGNLVSSGVYVYLIQSGGKEYKGKIAVVRE